MNLRVPPPGITQTQSYTWVMREVFIGILQPLFPGYTILRTNQVPIQRAQLPVLGVYLLDEKMTPDGDWNAGDIRFIHDVRYGFSIVIAQNDADAAEQTLDAAWWTVMGGIWANISAMKMFNNPNPDGTTIEGCMLGIRRLVYGAVGLNNETPTAELQYEATCRFRTDWPPTILDTLQTMVVTVVPGGFDPTQTETITVEYDFDATG